MRTSYLVEGDDGLLVDSGDVEGVAGLALQDGVFQLGVLAQVGVCCRDPAYLSARDGQLRHGEGPHTCRRHATDGASRAGALFFRQLKIKPARPTEPIFTALGSR